MQPNTKMSSGQATFDLKAAREAMTRATERPNVATDIYHLAALTYLPAALDEVEQLQTRDAAMQAQIVANAKRIAELEKKYKWAWVKLAENGEILQKQRVALKKLGQAKRERGKALVEERAQWNAICRDVGADPSDRYCTGEGEDGYPDARDQLRREGKL